MNDNYIFVPIFFVIIFTFIFGMFCGTTIENNRLYQKCMVENGTMVYNDATAKCREQVK